MTVQVPSHVRIMTQTWGLAQNDGLGTVRDDPDFFGRGLSLTDDRYLGSGTYDSGLTFNRYQQKRKIEWPHKGYVQTYPIRVTNDVVHLQFSVSVVPAGNLSDDLAGRKDAGVLYWWSRTPGGEPMPTAGGKKNVRYMYRVEQVNKSMYQRYSLKDPINSKGDITISKRSFYNGQENGQVLPIINKTYYINFAGVDSTVAEQCALRWGNTENPNPRAPRADELVKFPATDISGRPTLSFISQVSCAWVDYNTYLRNVT